MLLVTISVPFVSILVMKTREITQIIPQLEGRFPRLEIHFPQL